MLPAVSFAEALRKIKITSTQILITEEKGETATKYSVKSDKGMVRAINQDSCYLTVFDDNMCFAVVCDGMADQKQAILPRILQFAIFQNGLLQGGVRD